MEDINHSSTVDVQQQERPQKEQPNQKDSKNDPRISSRKDSALPVNGLSDAQRDNFVKLLAKFISHREAEKKNSEEILFDMFRNEETDLIPIGKFLAALRTFGLRMSDPRLKDMMHNLKMVHRSSKSEGSPETQSLDRETFKQWVKWS